MRKRSFFERLTGGVRLRDEETEEKEMDPKSAREITWMEEESEEGELPVDVYQTPSDIVIQTMIAGVKPEDLQINISRDMVTIKGKREESRTINEENYFAKELYWGSFSRTILLPQEVDQEEAEAVERNGLLTIKIPKLDKGKKTMLRVKSV